MTEEEMKKLLERVEKLEHSLSEKEQKISQLENDNKELTGKIATLKVDGLVKKVEDTQSAQPVEQDTITFDFDL